MKQESQSSFRQEEVENHGEYLELTGKVPFAEEILDLLPPSLINSTRLKAEISQIDRKRRISDALMAMVGYSADKTRICPRLFMLSKSPENTLKILQEIGRLLFKYLDNLDILETTLSILDNQFSPQGFLGMDLAQKFIIDYLIKNNNNPTVQAFREINVYDLGRASVFINKDNKSLVEYTPITSKIDGVTTVGLNRQVCFPPLSQEQKNKLLTIVPKCFQPGSFDDRNLPIEIQTIIKLGDSGTAITRRLFELLSRYTTFPTTEAEAIMNKMQEYTFRLP